MSSGQYKWGNDSLPSIKNHSLCKHKIIKDYLIEYILVRCRKLFAYPGSTLNLTIVDGFAGGGIYEYNGQIKYGSPLIIAQAIKEAGAILKSQYRSNHVNLDIALICIEKNVEAANSLKNILRESEYSEENIQVWHGEFGQNLPRVIGFIKEKSNKKGKCLFLLDQFGYTDVLGSQLQQILQMNSEVILTFAVDSLIAFLSKEKKPALRTIGFNDAEIDLLLSLWDRPDTCKADIQLVLSQHIKKHSRAPFFTPFLIHSDVSNWGYWLVHLSKHYKARAVMMDVHWKHGNGFVHYGKPGLDMLSYKSTSDILYTGQEIIGEEFRFDAIGKSKSMEVLPEEIARIVYENPIEFGTLMNHIFNDTPASRDMIINALWEVKNNGEVSIPRNKKDRIQDKDIISAPQKTLFSLPNFRHKHNDQN